MPRACGFGYFWVMSDPLDLFRLARGREPKRLGQLLEDPRAARRAADAFEIEAGILVEKRDPVLFRDLAADARRSSLGLARWQNLSALRERLAAADDAAGWPDTPMWMWGPRSRSGVALFGGVAAMGRGRITRALVGAGWTPSQLLLLLGEWLDAAKAHRSSRDRAWQVFQAPRAPVVQGRSKPSPPTWAMQALALQLGNGDAQVSEDIAIVLAWLAARAGGGPRVTVPSTALTQGRARHVDAPGISARRGRKVWPIVRDNVLRRTRNHSARRFAAEFEFQPQFMPIFVTT